MGKSLATFVKVFVLAATMLAGCAAADDEPLSESADEISAPAEAEAVPGSFCGNHIDCLRNHDGRQFCCNNRCVRPVSGLICWRNDGEGSSE
jgi:hypothetical protein